MRRMILFLILSLFINVSAMAMGSRCFLVKTTNLVLIKEGDCELRYSPCSTFKIALSLMGYDAGILKDETHPEWPFKVGYPDYIEAWKKAQNPRLWIKNSCVWYSQVLTQKLGMHKFKDYVVKFNYGNKDVSGDKGKGNGLTHAWLSSSLEISPEEQSVLLLKLLSNQLPVNRKAHEMTKNILFMETLPHGWKLYGKTGSGSLLSMDKTKKLDLQHGWFVGWIQRNGQIFVFVNHIIDDKKQDTYAGLRAKADTKDRLLKFIDELEQKVVVLR